MGHTSSRLDSNMSALTLSSTFNVARNAGLSKSRAAKTVRRAAIATKAAVKVGDAAPDFTLMGAGFETTSLSSLKGQKVVLAFFSRGILWRRRRRVPVPAGI